MLACSSNISSHARAHTRQHLRLSTQPWDWMLQCFLTSHCLLCWVLQTCRPTGSHIVGLAEAADLAEEVYRLPGMYLDRLYLVINGNKVFSQCYYPKFHWREKGRRACCRHAGLLGRDLFCMCVSPNSQLAGILRPACSLLLALAHPGSLSLPSIHCSAPAAHSGNPTLWLHSTTVQGSAWSHRLRRRYKSLALSPGCAWKQGQGAARGKKDMCNVWFQQLVSWVRVSCKSCTLSSSSNSLCAWCVQISSTRPSPEPHDFEKAIYMTAHSPKPALFL